MGPATLLKKSRRTSADASKVADYLDRRGLCDKARALRILIHQHSEACRHLSDHMNEDRRLSEIQGMLASGTVTDAYRAEYQSLLQRKRDSLFDLPEPE